ncbi:MAG: apolipoprotein N-acyltransferase [Acetobacteraceae bacterium]|nr:apolipoprotein N-acyltransferase [Acetobacteraceae bacterium]
MSPLWSRPISSLTNTIVITNAASATRSTEAGGAGRAPFRRFAFWLDSRRGWRGDGAALLLGMVSALAYPPIFVLPALLVGIPGLLILVGAARGPAVAARRGWWFGFGLNLIGLYWITEAILLEAAQFWWCVPLAVPGLSALMAAFIAPVCALARCAHPGWPRVLALAGAWVLSDLARQFVLGGFPWNPWGSVWEFPGYPGDVFIQPTAWVGVHGLTFLTLLLTGVPLLSWAWRGAAVGLLGAWAVAGVLRLGTPAIPPPEPVTAVLIQGDIPEGLKWDNRVAAEIFRRYLILTQEGVAAAGSGRKVVIWPETASPYLLGRDTAARQYIAEAAGGNPALVGAVSFAPDGRPLNTLFALDRDGRIAGRYDKWHLVPFGEYQPSWAQIGLQLIPGEGFQPGPGPETLKVPGSPPFAPFICYEAIFTHQIVNEDSRPDWMVNITNDAWFGNSTGPRQHLAAARLRAVEEGLPLIRAANTGISAAFDALGREIARLGMNRAGYLDVPLPGRLPPTVYERLGLPIPLTLGVLGVAIGLWAGGLKQILR